MLPLRSRPAKFRAFRRVRRLISPMLLRATDTLDEPINGRASVAQARTDVEIAQKAGSRYSICCRRQIWNARCKRDTAEYEASDLTAADPSNSHHTETPTKLSAVGYSNGVNVLKYKGTTCPARSVI
jgi:hypothetical protein